ncbi:hypothetical protein EHF33_10340 [Deinococcus psychrotolerans]|uniref:Uncharacterized protein n=1 Tax=Deinococcus psychrotolerans TaxID=2489213 RepID=A0A3G8YNB5_9DEIO|nr:hypothetical protein [Deinococcus psychrotolerans]AZI43091.1 hypothetical protein EHF33_10340 [Deinococcus psychrotolerans]
MKLKTFLIWVLFVLSLVSFLFSALFAAMACLSAGQGSGKIPEAQCNETSNVVAGSVVVFLVCAVSLWNIYITRSLRHRSDSKDDQNV